MHEVSPTVLSRHARALKILNCLQAGPRFNAKELANQLKVSRRTIYRDLNLIREAGVPVFFDESYDAYRLGGNSEFVEPPRFDEDDLVCLVMMTQMSLMQTVPEWSARVREALSKLLVLYPSPTRLSATRLLNACVTRLPCVPSLTLDIFKAVLRSIQYQKQIRLLVERDPLLPGEQLEETAPASGAEANGSNGQVWTRFSPFRVVLSDERWMVVGRSSVHRRTRSFDLRRIHNAEFTDTPFVVPRGFRSRM